MVLELSEGTVLEDRYRIQTLIGQGGMGAVYKASHLRLKRTVAVKVLRLSGAADEAMITRFKIEARSAANIHHPHIVEVMDFGLTPDNRPFFVMEYLVGESLADKLSAAIQLPELEVVEITDQILSGLAVAHKAGIVHRDLKPENIFLASFESNKTVVKILDFGISKIVRGSPSRPPLPITDNHAKLTEVGIVLGTPGYMAPESLFGSIDLDARADLFSVGVLMYEMLTGRRPFRGSDAHKTMVATATKPVPSPRCLRPQLTLTMDRAVVTALAKDPKDRFQTAKEFLDHLSAAAVGRLPDDARPCRTDVGIPSMMPPAQKEQSKWMTPSPVVHKAPKQHPPKAGSPPVPYAAGAPLEDVRTRHRAIRARSSRMRRISSILAPLQLIFFIGLGVAVYYVFWHDRPVVVSSHMDPIDKKIQDLEARSQMRPAQKPTQRPEKRPLRPDGTPVSAAVTIWLETSPPDVTVILDGRVLLERPLVVPGGVDPVTLAFSAPGYRDQAHTFVPDQEKTLTIRMKKIKK
ncbi:MAG: serine/threonine-protein kinase [Myxococcota bacterium]|nr:serine/threonine-protein kinase [Myxococcota bacterium]